MSSSIDNIMNELRINVDDTGSSWNLIRLDTTELKKKSTRKNRNSCRPK